MDTHANQSFTELEVSKKGRELKKEIALLAKNFPPGEKYRISDQLIRAVRSVNATIAEGHGRFTYKAQLHFCIQARGLLPKKLNQLIDASACEYKSQDQLLYYQTKVDDVGKLLNGSITYLRKNI
jgi:four helix bundle protein